ncbi:MBL fold metallo-hydrolase [Plantactinospora sonchi]|uniref:MBL fold metallo-hydrolase n=1 Tax=Plantactinospora sonchi TaxID=1544735 RepID=A0ABU7RX06_9ACTN
MRITILGGHAAYPTVDAACSGYLVERDGFHLLVDPGYAVLPRLLAGTSAHDVDAVYVSHGHPDHCADLQPLLRIRALTDPDAPALPVFTPRGSLDRLLAIDEPGLIDASYDLREFEPGAEFEIGPFRAATWGLPHWLPNAGVRLTAGGRMFAYTGDTGPSPHLVELAREADLLLAEATFADELPARYAGNLSTAAEVGRYAAEAGAARVLLTHLWPRVEPAAFVTAAGAGFTGPVEVAESGLVVDV